MAGNQLSANYKYILDNYKPLTKEEELIATPHDLVMHNFRYMFTAFKKYMAWMSHDEYASEIIAGLYDAANRFDKNSGYKFFTYAKNYVNLYLINYKRKFQNVVSFNPSILNKIETLKTFIANYTEKHGEKPSKSEILKKFNYSEKMYKQYMGYITQFNLVPLDKKIAKDKSDSSNQSRTISEVISADDIVDMDDVQTDELYEKQDMIESMKVAFKQLNKYEQYVIDHYVLRNEPLGKIAKAMKTNNAKVQEIHASAINKMRSYVNS